MPPLALSQAFPSAPFGFATQNRYGDLEPETKGWGIGNSSSFYRVEGWGAPYFRVNGEGNIAARTHARGSYSSEEIDIMHVVERVVNDGMSLPLIIRFPDILRHRLSALHGAFQRGIALNGYEGRFQGVFPVKCNPDRYIVEDIVQHGKQFRFGLEAGSKPELVMAMTSMCKGSPDALLICNGYKDAEYVRLALFARKLGLKSVVVLEQEEEVDIVLQVSRQLGVQPVIGIRAKLCTKHDGHWGETSGEKGKFGLSTSEIVEVVSKLRRAGMLGCLQLLHFHIGSQIPSLALVDEGVSEAAHIFCELELMGANMKYIDIGGGLGVDYDGSHSSTSEMSVGYTLDDYAEHVVFAIKEACSLKNVKNPTISCESGRGLVSHCSVLVFDILSARSTPSDSLDDLGIPLEIEGLPKELSATYEEFSSKVRHGDYEGSLDHARTLKMEGIRLFKAGVFSLERRAMMEKLFDIVNGLVIQREQPRMNSLTAWPVGKGPDVQTATYHINLSIFKSMPDSWAIRQLFPIVPLHRHDEEPSINAVLSDLTCDSDGKISTFIGHGCDTNQSGVLRLHTLQPKTPYYLGMFLGGAYQEVLGSMHNLFGSPNVVHVEFSDIGFEITRSIPGQTIEDVLRIMLQDPQAMMEDLKTRVEDCASAGRFGSEFEADVVGQCLSASFGSSTYLSNDYRGGCAFAASKSKLACSTVEPANWCT